MIDRYDELVGYVLEWNKTAPVFETIEDYRTELCKDTATIWELRTKPQPGCPQEPVVYFKSHCVLPSFHKKPGLGLRPLYRGVLVRKPVAKRDKIDPSYMIKPFNLHCRVPVPIAA